MQHFVNHQWGVREFDVLRALLEGLLEPSWAASEACGENPIGSEKNNNVNICQIPTENVISASSGLLEGLLEPCKAASEDS